MVVVKSFLSVALLAITPTICEAEENYWQVLFVAHELHIHEGGGFGSKTWHELDSNEFRSALTAACTYFGCTAFVPAIAAGIHYGQPSTGNDYMITGRIDKQVGEQWWIAFPAPQGYVTCSATYDSPNISANTGDTTTGIVFRNPSTGENWVGTYSVVPKNRPEGHWVDVNFVVKYVTAGTEGSHGCVPNGTHVWDVHL